MGHSNHSNDAHLKENLAKYEKFKWMLTKQDPQGLVQKLFKIDEYHNEEPNFTEFHENSLTNKEKLNFVLLALEKVHHMNPSAISLEDSKYLHPAKTGLLLKTYFVSLYIPVLYGGFKIVQSRNFSFKAIGLFFGYLAATQTILIPAPIRYKEWLRRIRARPIALKYFEKQKGRLDLFKKILDPRTDHHELHHLKL